MAMTVTETFEWMRRRIYQELEPEVERLRSENVKLSLEVARWRTKNIRAEEESSQNANVSEIRIKHNV